MSYHFINHLCIVIKDNNWIHIYFETYLQQDKYRSSLTIVTLVWAVGNIDVPDSSPTELDDTIQLHANTAAESLFVEILPQLPGMLQGHHQY
jgi:hypothetical protein